MKEISNLPASVAARLLKQARQSGIDYQILLTNYCFERFLFRLGESPARDRFILKGAMLLRVWSEQPYRATRDLDLLRRGASSEEAIREDIRLICTADVKPDGVRFDNSSLGMEKLRPEEEYSGVRVILPAECNTARLRLQIDMGTGDSVWPRPRLSGYPPLLEFPAPKVLAYPPEAVIAEKFEAMIILGNRNSRIKDFFDLSFLAKTFEFDRQTLAEVVRRTFQRRQTRIPAGEPVGLTKAYWENPSRAAQVRAFTRRTGLAVKNDSGQEILTILRPFLLPILDDLRDGIERPGVWPAGGPWRSDGSST